MNICKTQVRWRLLWTSRQQLASGRRKTNRSMLTSIRMRTWIRLIYSWISRLCRRNWTIMNGSRRRLRSLSTSCWQVSLITSVLSRTSVTLPAVAEEAVAERAVAGELRGRDGRNRSYALQVRCGLNRFYAKAVLYGQNPVYAWTVFYEAVCFFELRVLPGGQMPLRKRPLRRKCLKRRSSVLRLIFSVIFCASSW